MKLTPGRMAHVKVENGCVEALLGRQMTTVLELPAWGILALRTYGGGLEGMKSVVPASQVHEPYGCMREIVVFPAEEPPSYASFGPASDYRAAAERMTAKLERDVNAALALRDAPKVDIRIGGQFDPVGASRAVADALQSAGVAIDPPIKDGDGAYSWQCMRCDMVGSDFDREAFARMDGVRHQEKNHSASSVTRDVFSITWRPKPKS
jgi:hypothetical protein